MAINKKGVNEARNQELLEIYKVHAVAADDVSRRRDSANRMYLAATTAIFVVMGIALREGTFGIPTLIVIAFLSIIGALIQYAWIDVIDTYKQLNECKFKVLCELENEIAYSFYQKEWNHMKQGQNKQMTVTEKNLPILLRLAFGMCAAASIVSVICMSANFFVDPPSASF